MAASKSLVRERFSMVYSDRETHSTRRVKLQETHHVHKNYGL